MKKPVSRSKAREYVAYQGPAFTIEWYYDEAGESQALAYYNELDSSDKLKVLLLFKRMGDVGVIHDRTIFRNEGDKIFAFKPQPHRFLNFFVQGKKIIVSNAFWKKQDKLPASEKKQALACMASYNRRVKQGKYYEED